MMRKKGYTRFMNNFLHILANYCKIVRAKCRKTLGITMEADKAKNEKYPFWQHYSTSPLQINNVFYTPSKIRNRFQIFHEVDFFPGKNRWTNHQGFYQNLPNF